MQGIKSGQEWSIYEKVAIINQRYGLEVNGGSELYSRQIAERLKAKYEVEVLTSCAVEYVKWTIIIKRALRISTE